MYPVDRNGYPIEIFGLIALVVLTLAQACAQLAYYSYGKAAQWFISTHVFMVSLVLTQTVENNIKRRLSSRQVFGLGSKSSLRSTVSSCMR